MPCGCRCTNQTNCHYNPPLPPKHELEAHIEQNSWLEFPQKNGSLINCDHLCRDFEAVYKKKAEKAIAVVPHLRQRFSRRDHFGDIPKMSVTLKSD